MSPPFFLDLEWPNAACLAQVRYLIVHSHGLFSMVMMAPPLLPELEHLAALHLAHVYHLLLQDPVLFLLARIALPLLPDLEQLADLHLVQEYHLLHHPGGFLLHLVAVAPPCFRENPEKPDALRLGQAQ